MQGVVANLHDVYVGFALAGPGAQPPGRGRPAAAAAGRRPALIMSALRTYREQPYRPLRRGEFWVAARMMGSATRADFEHCDVALFLGKNPWHSHSIPRARVTLKALAADPARTLIVVDPRRTETAELADIHLAPRPGTDAHLLVAILGILLAEGLVDQAFLAAHVPADELAQVSATIARHPVAEAIAHTGCDPALVYRAARAIGGARALASFEDLGVQMNRHSTLVSYLHRVLILLTGSLGKPGTHYIPTTLVDITAGDATRTTPGFLDTICTGTSGGSAKRRKPSVTRSLGTSPRTIANIAGERSSSHGRSSLGGASHSNEPP